MRKIIHIYSVIVLLALTSCDPEKDDIIFDIQNGQSVASFITGEVIVINPAANTQNTISIGVNTIANNDRTFSISVDPDSTLDPAFYDIELTGNIPAGSFIGEVTLTTFATNIFPVQGSMLSLNLESVEGALIDIASSRHVAAFPFTVECPSVDLTNITGTATTTVNELLAAFGVPETDSDPRTIVAGPGENQITIEGGFGVASSDDIILNIDPVTGNITNGSPDGTLIFVNGGTTPVPITGISGKALTCINQISIEASNGVFGGAFAEFTLTLIIQ